MRHAVIRILLVATALLYAPLTLGLSAGLCLAVYRVAELVAFNVPAATSISRRGYGVALLAMLVLSMVVAGMVITLLAGLFTLFRRWHCPPVFGMPLSRDQHPGFFDLLDRVCRKIRVKPPKACYLSPFDEMSIGDRAIIDEQGQTQRNVRTLVVGAALLVHIRIDELTTILCHEMAHAKAGDIRFRRLINRFHFALVSAIEAQYQAEAEAERFAWLNGLLRLGLVGYYRWFGLLYCAHQRWCERRADRASAQICGQQHVRNALIKTHLTAYLPELSIEALLIEYSQDESDITSLYAEHRRRWEQLPTGRRREAENQMFLDRHSLYDSHPCLTERMRALKGVESKEISAPKPAARLFFQWNRLEEELTAVLVKRGRYLHRAYMNRLLAGR